MWDWGCLSVGRALDSCAQSPGSIPSTNKPGAVARARHSNIWEVKAGELEVQGYPWLHSEFKASLGCMIILFKNQTVKTIFKKHKDYCLPLSKMLLSCALENGWVDLE